MVQQRTLTPAQQEPPREKMTYEEFLDWVDEDTYAEWVDGEIIMMSPASDRHQDIVRFLTTLLSIYCETYDLGIIRPVPFQMKTGAELPGREPDVLFLHRDHLDRRQETYLDGPADLVIEIVSPESLGRDRGDKFVEYEAGGVLEYWLIDPQREQAEFYRLGDDGRYRLVTPDAGGVYHSAVLTDFWLRVDWLWQEPLPPTEEILLEVGGEVYARRLIAQLRARGFLTDDE